MKYSHRRNGALWIVTDKDGDPILWSDHEEYAKAAAEAINTTAPSIIYELLDVTDDEMYYPLGIFVDLESAVRVVEDHETPWYLSHVSSECEYSRLEIRERSIGLSDTYNTVKRWEWHADYAEHGQELEWKEGP